MLIAVGFIAAVGIQCMEGEKRIVMQSFKTFPTEIDGCSCYFSQSKEAFKKKEYFYVSNLMDTAFIKADGKWIRFVRTESKKGENKTMIEKFSGQDMEMTLVTNAGTINGDETQLHSGSLTLEVKGGSKIKKEFYGECGC